MVKSLPHHVNPWFLYRHNESVAGVVQLSAMPQLQSMQLSEDGVAHVDFSVVRREDGKVALIGSANINLKLTCQRCLQPLDKLIEAEFELVLVKYESQLESVSEDDDAIVIEDELQLAPMVEQELILELPMIAKHENCEANHENQQVEAVDRQQPFANLKDLLS